MRAALQAMWIPWKANILTQDEMGEGEHIYCIPTKRTPPSILKCQRDREARPCKPTDDPNAR